ncbi:MAG: hypothetical protein GY719_20095 [bacterium]|nr:hypothetical protein [bacterium]
MPDIDITPSLVLSLAILVATVGCVFVPCLYLIWRNTRNTHRENSELLTAVLALSKDNSAAQLASIRADAEAQDKLAHQGQVEKIRARRPRAAGA